MEIKENKQKMQAYMVSQMLCKEGDIANDCRLYTEGRDCGH